MIKNNSFLDFIPRKLAVLVSAAMILTGLVLGLWTLSSALPASWHLLAGATRAQGQPNALAPLATGLISPTTDAAATGRSTTETLGDSSGASVLSERTVTSTEGASAGSTAVRPVEIALHDGVPTTLRSALEAAVPSGTALRFAAADAALPDLRVDLNAVGSELTYKQVYVATTRFDTVTPQQSWRNLRTLWQEGGDGRDESVADEESASGSLEASLRAAADAPDAAGATDGMDGVAPEFAAVAVLTDTIPALESVLGRAGAVVQGYETIEEIAAAVYEETPTVALVPFELLQPSLLALAINGQNPVENAQKFDADAYPLVVPFYTHIVDAARSETTGVDARSALQQFPITNRDPGKITVLAMTGVTAMVRGTAAQMDELGDAWPAEMIGPELSLADITHVSNEVPFVPDCETNTSADNLTFCSKPSYMRALEALGTDIVGLTGNHQNDYGREGALASLAIYAEAGLPVYGGGENKEAAFAPYYMEHNGNRLAFLGANSFGPAFAWAGDDSPGSAEFDLAILSAMVRNIKAKGLADLVLVELQYQETYDVQPLIDQRLDFTALVAAGADIVTGVQSHVPQGIEFDEGHLVLYGLGNLFFDQMWTQETREGLIPKHTFYDGRHISTQLLTTMLYDAGQPHWTTPQEREQILSRVFEASYLE